MSVEICSEVKLSNLTTISREGQIVPKTGCFLCRPDGNSPLLRRPACRLPSRPVFSHGQLIYCRCLLFGVPSDVCQHYFRKSVTRCLQSGRVCRNRCRARSVHCVAGAPLPGIALFAIHGSRWLSRRLASWRCCVLCAPSGGPST